MSDAYAVAIATDLMEPRYYQGEVAYVSPAIPPRPGDFVFARLKDGRAGVRRMKALANHKVTFETMKDGATVEIDVSEIEALHRIVGSAG